MASSAGLELLVVSSNLTSTMKTSEFPHVKNLISTLSGPPEIGTASWWHVDPYIRSGPEYPAVPGGGECCKAQVWEGDRLAFFQ